ncbi:MAG TPA: DUF4149 domain-containing protein [Aquifex aeolicus]|uniref:DUF4149 domain-containing protein n=1 Tax=Aquifex aeolicus TaxID=63363 RepID=A0A9D0YP68_AQUAO|nr:DUF4149 domain-containing protein [Aquifex aeolicus]
MDVNPIAEKLVLAFTTATFSIGVFFSFVIAPILFKTLGKEQAGKIVEKTLPLYFALCLGLDALSLLAVFKANVGFILILILILTITLNAVQLYIIFPESREKKRTDYQGFLKLHKISLTFNIAVILLNLTAVLYLIFKPF